MSNDEVAKTFCKWPLHFMFLRWTITATQIAKKPVQLLLIMVTLSTTPMLLLVVIIQATLLTVIVAMDMELAYFPIVIGCFWFKEFCFTVGRYSITSDGELHIREVRDTDGQTDFWCTGSSEVAGVHKLSPPAKLFIHGNVQHHFSADRYLV